MTPQARELQAFFSMEIIDNTISGGGPAPGITDSGTVLVDTATGEVLSAAKARVGIES